MKISGFTFIKNASKLYIPAKEAILSVLPIVDEFVIAVGDNDIDDNTLEIIESINSPKIKIINTVWDKDNYLDNTIFAQQTDVAKEACSGDWLIYIQGDEAIHEEDYLEIKKALEDNLDNKEVEGFLFNYKHFWGDFKHYHKSHFWYPKEIRIIRNDKKIHSWKDAQSFRKFEEFNYSKEDYQRKEGTEKLRVIELSATIYHYGHARPPRTMSKKHISFNKTRLGDTEEVEQELKEYYGELFDYGPLDKIPVFKGTHPEVMKEWVEKFDWADDLQYSGKVNKEREPFGHEKPKQRFVSWLENNLLGGRQIMGFKNYISLGKIEK
jgi:hypothetical protein